MIGGQGWAVHDPGHTLVLIACSGRKLHRPAAVRDIYTGTLFQGSLRWAESWDLQWQALSSMHGLVRPDQVIAPYDRRITQHMRDQAVRGQLPAGITAIVTLGGEMYVRWARALWPELEHWAPLQELELRGYGYYRSWLNTNLRRAS